MQESRTWRTKNKPLDHDPLMVNVTEKKDNLFTLISQKGNENIGIITVISGVKDMENQKQTT